MTAGQSSNRSGSEGSATPEPLICFHFGGSVRKCYSSLFSFFSLPETDTSFVQIIRKYNQGTNCTNHGHNEAKQYFYYYYYLCFFFFFSFLAHAHFLLRTCKEDMSRGGWEGSFRKLEEENLAPWLRRAHWRFENKVFDINTNLCPNIATCNETTSNLLLP